MSKIDLKETMSIQSDHIDEDRSLGVFLLGDKCYIAMECSIDVYNIVTGVITERIPMINDGLLVVSRDKTSFFTSRLWGMIVYYCINTRLREEYPSLFGRVFDIVEGKPGITFACGNDHFCDDV
jgi:hypothetical protein